MAERRMFAKTIIDSDAFLDMPLSTQALYFHLAMRADDEGFINNPKSIMRNTKCSEDDIKLLILKKFIIPFESGVVVIKHWKIHNYIQKDRFIETKYKEEKAMLNLDENKAYKIENNECIQNVSTLDTQDSIGKYSKGKNSKEKKENIKEKKVYGEFKNVLLTDDELEKLKTKFVDYEERIENLSIYLESTNKKYASHYATILSWKRREEKEEIKKESEKPKKFSNEYYENGDIGY